MQVILTRFFFKQLNCFALRLNLGSHIGWISYSFVYEKKKGLKKSVSQKQLTYAPLSIHLQQHLWRRRVHQMQVLNLPTQSLLMLHRLLNKQKQARSLHRLWSTHWHPDKLINNQIDKLVMPQSVVLKTIHSEFSKMHAFGLYFCYVGCHNAKFR